MIYRWLTLIGTIFALLAPTSATHAQMNGPVVVERWLQEAEELEQQGQWEKAFHAYCRLLAADRQLPGLRDRLHVCLRHLLQVRRHRDPSFTDKVLSLPIPRALDLYAEVVAKLQVHYVDRDRSLPSKLLQAGFDEFIHALDDENFRRLHLRNISDASIRQFQGQLQEAWSRRIVRDSRDARLLVREVAMAAQRELQLSNPVVVVMEFLAGTCNALDEYTAYLTPGQLIAETSRPLQELYSFGIRLVIENDEILITAVRPQSLADYAGLRKDDRLIRVQKHVVTKPTLDRLLTWLRPTSGAVELEWSRGPEEQFTLQLPTQFPSVAGKGMLKENIGYLQLLAFRDTTLAELDDSILSLKARGMRALILDLRGNPGGLFLPSVQAAERFIGEGVIVSTQGQLDEFTKSYTSMTGMSAHQFPLFVLIDGETASAAEVLAAALKEHQRAVLIGTPTFGKGTIQAMRPLEAGAVRFTVARIYSPLGSPLSQLGVTPHYVEANRERQLDTALDQASRLFMGMDMVTEGMRP